jgi:hypothetical protein
MSAQPAYVSFEAKEREQLLSQIGDVSPAERQLFEQLCQMWEPRIPVAKLAERAESPEQLRGTLQKLVSRLRSQQLGLLRTETTPRGKEPTHVVLTNAGDVDFWRELLDEESIGSSLEARLQLPTEERLEQWGLLPPQTHIQDADSGKLARAYASPSVSKLIYRLKLLDDCAIVFPTDAAKRLVSQAFATLRKEIEERGVTEELARLNNGTITETKQHLQSRAPDVWLKLTKTLVKERPTITYRKNLAPKDELFQLAYLVMSFVEAKIGLAQQSKEQRFKLDEQIQEIVKFVQAAPGGILPREHFERLIDEKQQAAGDSAEELMTALQRRVFTPKIRRSLPLVIYMHGSYIHQDELKRVFEVAISQVRERVRDEYVDLLQASLRGRDSDIGEILGSKDRLNDDLVARIERLHPLLGEIIARQKVLAEAIVRDAKAHHGVKKPDQLRRFLSRYFNVDTSQLRPLSEILSLDVVAALETAFSKLNVFRQFVLRITGRYESLRGTYMKRFIATRKTKAERDQARREEMAARPPGEDSSGGAPAPTDSDGPRVVSPSRRRRHAPSPKPRPRSRREIESSWRQFGEAVHTKPEDDS